MQVPVTLFSLKQETGASVPLQTDEGQKGTDFETEFQQANILAADISDLTDEAISSFESELEIAVDVLEQPKLDPQSIEETPQTAQPLTDPSVIDQFAVPLGNASGELKSTESEGVPLEQIKQQTDFASLKPDNRAGQSETDPNRMALFANRPETPLSQGPNTNTSLASGPASETFPTVSVPLIAKGGKETGSTGLTADPLGKNDPVTAQALGGRTVSSPPALMGPQIDEAAQQIIKDKTQKVEGKEASINSVVSHMVKDASSATKPNNVEAPTPLSEATIISKASLDREHLPRPVDPVQTYSALRSSAELASEPKSPTVLPLNAASSESAALQVARGLEFQSHSEPLQGLRLGELTSSQPVKSPMFQPLNPELLRAEVLVPKITGAMEATLARGAQGSFELKLSPAELGTIRMVMTHSEAGITAIVSADRSEVLDLLRRHGDSLLADLRAGHEGDVNLAFQDQKSEQNPQNTEDTEQFGVPQDVALTRSAAEAALTPTGVSLDIRL